VVINEALEFTGAPEGNSPHPRESPRNRFMLFSKRVHLVLDIRRAEFPIF
jgi:hypothetical protein